jgi:Na+-driven multidrug efflux pump
LTEAAERAGKYEDVVSAWNVVDRVYIFVVCICLGLNQGLLPAASYAFGSGRLNRLLRLSLVTVAMGTVWSVTCCTVIIAIPKQIAGIWGSGEGFKQVCATMLFRGFVTCWLNQCQLTMTAMLQAMKMILLSVVASILMLMVPLPIFAAVLYVTGGRSEPERLVYAYVANDGWGFVIVVIICLWKLRFLLEEEPSGSGEAVKEVELQDPDQHYDLQEIEHEQEPEPNHRQKEAREEGNARGV